jgi:putative acetyltransferase
MPAEWIIRRETSHDYDAIDRVIAAASGEQETVELVRNLRLDGDALVSIVAEWDSRVVGHILMSRMLIEADDRLIPAVALAPLMVEPAFQNKGAGQQLTQLALQHCSDSGEEVVLVLGHPTYYPRFGFSSALTQCLEIPFTLKVPGAYMALELKPGALNGIRGRVRYPKAFRLAAEWTM